MKVNISTTEAIEIKRSPVLDYVMTRLVKKYPDFLVSHTDFEWLNEVNRVHGRKEITPRSLRKAVEEALPKEKEEYMKKAEKFSALCDPWELFIEAGIKPI